MIAWNVRVLEIIHLTTGVKKDSNGNRHKEYTKLSSFHTILKNKNFMIICNRTLSLISKAATVHLAIHMSRGGNVTLHIRARYKYGRVTYTGYQIATHFRNHFRIYNMQSVYVTLGPYM